MNAEQPELTGQILLSDLNALLRCCGVRRPAETLVNLIGIVGLRYITRG